jgi:hypothetical protein
MYRLAVIATAFAVNLGFLPAAEAQEGEAERWRKAAGLWRFTIDVPNQPATTGRLLIRPNGGLYVGVWVDGGSWNHVHQTRLDGDEFVVRLQFFWTSDEIRLKAGDGGGLRGAWTSSHNNARYQTTMTRVLPKLQSVKVQRLDRNDCILDVAGTADMPPPEGPYRIYGVVAVDDRDIHVQSASYADGNVLRVRLAVGDARPGPKTLIVNGAAISWQLASITPKLEFKERESSPPLRSLTYSKPFHIEARYETPRAEDQQTVKVEWSNGKTSDVVVKRTGDGTLYRSAVLKLKNPVVEP